MGDVPLHVHENNDEAFYILEGEYEIRCGDQTFLAGPGTFAYLPHGVPHAQRLKSDTATKLIFIAPGGFENWFIERSEAMKDGRYDDALVTISTRVMASSGRASGAGSALPLRHEEQMPSQGAGA